MEADAQAHRRLRVLVVRGHGPLDPDRAAQRAPRAREGDHEAVPLRLHLEAPVDGDLLAHDGAVGVEDLLHALVPQPLGHGAETHDVAEHDGDRAARLAHDPAVAQLDCPLRVARRERAVRHQDDGQVPLGVELPQQREDRLPRLRVEVAGRLVGQDESRLGHERPRDGDALLLAAGELGGAAARDRRRERHPGEGLARAPARLPPADAEELERPGHVLLRREGGEQVEALEDEADLPQADVAAGIVPQVGEVAPPDQHPPGARRIQARDQVENRALARAARAQDGDELARRDAEAHLTQGGDRLGPGVVALAHRFESDRDRRFHRPTPPGAPGRARAARPGGREGWPRLRRLRR